MSLILCSCLLFAAIFLLFHMQGVRAVKTGLGGLFGGESAADNDDPLIYHRPRDPTSARGAPSRVSRSELHGFAHLPCCTLPAHCQPVLS